MALHPVETDWIGRSESALAVVRYCKVPGCTFHATRRKPYPGGLGGGVGRGNGMREGNKQRGVLIQHVKAKHPDIYAAAMAGKQEN